MTTAVLEPKLDKVDGDEDENDPCHIAEPGNDNRALCGADISGLEWAADHGHECTPDCQCRECAVIQDAALAFGS